MLGFPTPFAMYFGDTGVYAIGQIAICGFMRTSRHKLYLNILFSPNNRLILFVNDGGQSLIQVSNCKFRWLFRDIGYNVQPKPILVVQLAGAGPVTLLLRDVDAVLVGRPT